jgi:hypothetical protein
MIGRMAKNVIYGSYRQVSILKNNAEVDGKHKVFTSLVCKVEASECFKNRIIPQINGIHTEDKQKIEHLTVHL